MEEAVAARGLIAIVAAVLFLIVGIPVGLICLAWYYRDKEYKETKLFDDD